MATAALPSSENSMRQISYTIPLLVTLSQASLVASLATAPAASATMIPAGLLGQEQFVAGLGDATDANATPRRNPSVSLLESVSSDLAPGESFTDAEAAAFGYRLAQRQASLPITEIDLGSDL